MKDFRNLQVWQKARNLTLKIYQVTAGFPRSELYGLSSQLRRASSSIGANLAQGCGRKFNAEFAQSCNIAAGEASELENHLLLAMDLRYITPEEYTELNERTIEIKRMLFGLQQRLTADR